MHIANALVLENYLPILQLLVKDFSENETLIQGVPLPTYNGKGRSSDSSPLLELVLDWTIEFFTHCLRSDAAFFTLHGRGCKGGYSFSSYLKSSFSDMWTNHF